MDLETASDAAEADPDPPEIAGPHPLADIAPGIYGGIPDEQYHSGPGISVSTLKRLAEAPAKALVRRPETPSLRFGTLTHLAILQPELLADRYHVVDLPRLDPRTKAYQAEKERAGGRTIVQQRDWDEAMRISDAVRRHPTARELLAAGLLIEQSGYWTDPGTGLLCRMRMDIVRPDMGVIGDLKSTTDASADEFARSVAVYAYDWQVAHYTDGMALAPGGFEPNAFVFIAVEKEPPYCVAVYDLEPEDIAIAAQKVRAHLLHYAECLRTNSWPGYPEGLLRLRMPPWARRAA